MTTPRMPITQARRDAYPISSNLEDRLKEYMSNPVVATMVDTFGEYEHGSADVEDVAEGMTLELYAGAVYDLALTICNTPN